MRLRFDRANFGSIVARRVFVLFLACALVPVGVLGVFAWVRSSRELERSARDQLRRDSKREGMMVLSRLLVADALLARFEARGERLSTPGALIANPWRSVTLVDPSHSPGGPLTASEVDSLRRGRAALRALPGRRLFLLRAASGESARGRVVAAEIEPSYVWTFDPNETEESLTIVADDGTLLFSSLPPETAAALTAALRPSDSGAAAEPIEVRGLIAEPWQMFVGLHFASKGWRVVRGELRSATLAPLAEFRSLFGWSALLAAFVVAALSSVQIRRTLGPLQALTQAANRLGEGHFDVRANIAERGEFGALGDAFDAMAAHVEQFVRAIESANAFGLAVSSEREESRLIALALQALRDMTRSRSVSFIRASEDGELSLASELGNARGIGPAVREAARSKQIARTRREGSEEIALPLLGHDGHLLGLLQIAEPSNERGGVVADFSETALAAGRSLASQAAIALTSRKLVDEFRALFEGLIDLTVRALDAKSPYTGGHCRRVPILAELIADAVCRTREGTFAGFEFTAAERYELRIAALLHDFGKIVTPVHVMDKATKLQTIHDRIELVAARYAVLARDEELAWLRRNLGKDGAGVGAFIGTGELSSELDFLRRANVGVERMSPEDQARVHEIAFARRWRSVGGDSQPVLAAEEIENLTISRGTLNAAERRIIEEHADQTIHLLERLPFPRALRNVPAIAGSHHERLDGGGYPLGLHDVQISLQGRLLGIADVFEALTAPDRPYRAPIRVSSAIAELKRMAKLGHIDADVLEVFLREGVHLQYAREYLRPEQLDDLTREELAGNPGEPRTQA